MIFRLVLTLQSKLSLVSLKIIKHMYLMDKSELEALLTEFNGLAVGLLKLTRKNS